MSRVRAHNPTPAAASETLFAHVRDLLGWRFAFRLRMLKRRVARKWAEVFTPYRLHPEWLTSYDGEPPYFCRADLAATPEAAVSYLAHDFGMTVTEVMEGMEPIETIALIHMVPRYDHTVPEDDERHCWYATVDSGEPGAVAYWRWGW